MRAVSYTDFSVGDERVFLLVQPDPNHPNTFSATALRFIGWHYVVAMVLGTAIMFRAISTAVVRLVGIYKSRQHKMQ
jgi:hypothetical protein